MGFLSVIIGLCVLMYLKKSRKIIEKMTSDQSSPKK